MSAPRLSIVLPTRDGTRTLPALLDSLWSQRTSGAIEVIAIDSGSSDGTVELLRSRGAEVIEIPPADFNHGATRNLAISRARGEFVVLLVQDAIPAAPDWLETLSAPLRADPSVAAAFARQVPHQDASAIAQHYLMTWVASSPVGRTIRLMAASELDALSPAQRLHVCAFDNVGACIRKSVWEQQPFRQTPIAEDLEWSRDVLRSGHAIAFVPEAVVLHSHDRTVGYEYRRTRQLHARLYALFGLHTIPSLPHLARAVASSMLLHLRLEWRHPSRWFRAAGLAIAWPLGQFVGARRARSAYGLS